MKKINKYLFVFLLSFFLLFPLFSDEAKFSSSFLNGLKVRSIGPAVMSGRITTVDAVDNNSNIIYVGTAGGGVWKSVNGGTSFKPIFEDHTMSIGCITIDQKNPETVWVGTGEIYVRNSVSVGTGLYKTDDGGRNWKFMGFKNSERIAKIIVHPEDSKIIYVAVMGHLWDGNEERGLYKSKDGGRNWKKILYIDEDTGCPDIEMDPQRPEVLYASMWEFRRKPYIFKSGGPGSGLYKSVDNGKNWKQIKDGLPEGNLGRISIAVSPSRPGTIYANIEASKKSGLYRSYDMGKTWELTDESISVKMRPFYFSNIVVDPNDYKRIYSTGLFLSVSKNAGDSFTSAITNMSIGGMHPDIHDIWIDPNNSNRVIVGTDGGVYISHNKAQSFEFMSNLPVSQFYHVSCDMAHPYNVYGGLQDNGAWFGPSRNFRAGSIRNKDWHNAGGGDGFYIFADPQDKDIVYYSWQEGSFERYNRRTNETKDIKPRITEKNQPELRFNWNAGVELSPNDPNLIYIGAQYLFKTENKGDSWEKISPDLTTNDPAKLQQEKSGGLTVDDTGAENHCTIFTISESPKNKDIIWVGTDDGNVQLTKDGGNTWENLVDNIQGLPEHTWCSSIEASHHSEAVAYATFDGHRSGDMTPYIYKTEDYGKTWKSLVTDNIKGYCHIVREDLKDSSLLFTGTEFGLYISFDKGKNWIRLKTLPKVAVRDIFIHPREHDLVMATHGLGFQIIDDITPLRKISDEILNSDVAILPSRDAVMRTPSRVQEYEGDEDFYGENPPGGAFVNYYLKRRHIFGDFKLSVYDKDGKIIQELPASKSKGINRAGWSMRYKPPKGASAPGLSGAMIASGPIVAPGEYTVKLKKKDKIYTGKIKLIPDPIAGHSEKDREIRRKAVMGLYQMQEDLGFIADSVYDLVKQAKDKKEKTNRNSVKKKLNEFIEKFDNFHKNIVQRKGLMTGGKLREKVMGLYSSIISYGGKPTESQLFNKNILKDKIEEVREIYDSLIEKDLEKMNNYLKSKKLKQLKLMTREEYEKEPEL